jgi:hypothetical protein
VSLSALIFGFRVRPGRHDCRADACHAVGIEGVANLLFSQSNFRPTTSSTGWRFTDQRGPDRTRLGEFLADDAPTLE